MSSASLVGCDREGAADGDSSCAAGTTGAGGRQAALSSGAPAAGRRQGQSPRFTAARAGRADRLTGRADRPVGAAGRALSHSWSWRADLRSLMRPPNVTTAVPAPTGC